MVAALNPWMVVTPLLLFGEQAAVLFWLYLACGMKSAISPWIVVIPLLLFGEQAAVLFCELYLELAAGG